MKNKEEEGRRRQAELSMVFDCQQTHVRATAH
jgi:hypothetical protein